MLIGLMGKSGSGKTEISLLFKEKCSRISVLDVDKIGHNAYQDTNVRANVIKHFGRSVINKEGKVDRKKIADIVFSDKAMMQKLYEITYGYMEKRIDEYISQNEIVLLDYALLPLTKYYDMCDVKILVTSEYSVRLNRAIKRDKISPEKYIKRDLNSVNYEEMFFDYVIENNDNIETLRKVVGDIYEKSIVPWKF